MLPVSLEIATFTFELIRKKIAKIMTQLKKVLKAKEPVSLRFKVLAKGSKSLYLDTYWNGTRHYEFLRMYLIPERDEQDRITNQATLKAANMLKAQRTRELILSKAGLAPPGSGITLTDWMEQCQREAEDAAKSKGRARTQYAKLYKQTRNMIGRFLSDCYAGSSPIRVTSVDKIFLSRLREWMDTVRSVKNGKLLSSNTKHLYFMMLSIALNKAVKRDMIPANPMLRMEEGEKPPKVSSQRQFLTVEELRRLMQTEGNRRITQPFLFSCLSGLRLSDIATLRWGDFRHTDNQWFVEKKIVKTQQFIRLPISRDAVDILPERAGKSDDDPVFQLQYDDGYASKYIAGWVRKAGISKHITFHCARHTFATLLLTLGADIYTTSKLLGHSNIQTTQIYAKVVDRKKIDAVNLLDGNF